MRIGLDLDGVLVNFNAAYRRKIVAVTGRDLFPEDFTFTTWNYDIKLGYTHEEISHVWNVIKGDRDFWYRLEPFHGEGVVQALDLLATKQARGADVYFITSRPGYKAKEQSEDWLRGYGFPEPTVLISAEKGWCAYALNLDHYIDDRTENVMSSKVLAPNCQTFLCTRTWNEHVPGVRRVASAFEFVSNL